MASSGRRHPYRPLRTTKCSCRYSQSAADRPCVPRPLNAAPSNARIACFSSAADHCAYREAFRVASASEIFMLLFH